MPKLNLTKDEAKVLSNAYALYSAVGLQVPKELVKFTLLEIMHDFEQESGPVYDAIESLADKMSDILLELDPSKLVKE